MLVGKYDHDMRLKLTGLHWRRRNPQDLLSQSAERELLLRNRDSGPRVRDRRLGTAAGASPGDLFHDECELCARLAHPGSQCRERGTTGSTVSHSHVRKGCDVYGIDVQWIGEVKDVRVNDVLVDRPLQRDVYVPFEAIQMIVDDWIILTIREEEVDDKGWPKPPLFRSRSAQRPARSELPHRSR
jgi:hypothetical protein